MHTKTPNDPEVLALRALAATLGRPDLSQRFLDLTGIGTEELRQRAGEAVLLAALLQFLEAHEPDLLVIAAAISIEPVELVEARRALEQREDR